MKKNDWKKLFCICIAVSFIMVLLKSLPGGYSIASAFCEPKENGENSASLLMHEPCISLYVAREGVSDVENSLPLAAKNLLSADKIPGIDDFQMLSDNYSPTSNLQGNAGNGMFLLLLALVILFFGNILTERRLSFPEQRISLYCVMLYIHHSDGKKKSHFDETIIKMGGYRSGNRYKIQNIINR